MPAHNQGEVLLAWLVFSDGQGAKRRPVLVVHDFGDDDLLVVPITSQRARVVTDLIPLDWKSAGRNCLQLFASKNWRPLKNLAWRESWACFHPPNWFGSKKLWLPSSNRFSSDKNASHARNRCAR
jgi:hypothetical protein